MKLLNNSSLHRTWDFLRVMFGVRLPVDRQVYAVSGFGLMILKYAAETGLIYYFTRDVLTPFEFLNPLRGERTRMLAAGPEWLGWALFVWTLPFVWIAFSMSVRRAADAGLSPWLGLLVLVPLLNLAVMLLLAVLPDRRTAALSQSSDSQHENAYAAPRTREEYWSFEAMRGELGEQQDVSRPQQMMRAISASLLLGAVMVGIAIYGLETYGVALFFGTPLVMGACCGFVYNRPQPQTGTLGVVCLTMLIAAGLLLLLAFEGLICILMAAPLVLPLAVFGAFIGKSIADSSRSTYSSMIPAIVVLPMLSGAECLRAPPQEVVVVTAIEIDAPPEAVWDHVIAFPELPEPQEWYFRMGIATPLRARIEGHGIGAIRYCEFTTGTFVEPITVWDRPNRLAFDVTNQPDPMFEISPYRHLHPPHMEHETLRSDRGEFRLVRLANEGTRIEGRTWYRFKMYPQGYWTLWSDMFIHRIHQRVLRHIKTLAERRDEAAG
jgi:uncharacterized membrane protein YhaH (DUF805 family)